MNILITGGNGFIGKHLVSKLLSENHNLILLSRTPPKISHPALKYIQCDLTKDLSGLLPQIQNEKIDLIFHCAGEIRYLEKMHDLHVLGTQNLLNLLLSCPEINRWIQLSSVGAYGPPSHPTEERTVSELTPENPQGIYEQTKTESDQLVIKNLTAAKMDFCILRPSNVIGPDMPNSSFRSLLKAIQKGFFFYVGKPGAHATYVHVKDVINALVLCSYKSEARNQIFNISSDCTFEELVQSVQSKTQKNKNIFHIPYFIALILTNFFQLIPNFPLTKTRINSLASRTTYSTLKIEKYLGLSIDKNPSRLIDDFI